MNDSTIKCLQHFYTLFYHHSLKNSAVPQIKSKKKSADYFHKFLVTVAVHTVFEVVALLIASCLCHGVNIALLPYVEDNQ